MANAIVRLDRVRAVYNGNIESVVYNAGVLQNGFVGIAGGYATAADRELRTLVQPTAGAGNLVLIYSPEIVKSEYVKTDNALENFSIPAGTAARAYRIEANDIYSVTTDGLTLIGAEPVKGNYLVADNGFKLKEVTAHTTEKFVARILDIEVLGTTTVVGQAGAISRINKYVVIEVIKNEA
ncbi:hypothetical protein MKY96_33180 [Paenibacillus sp. FSL R7-0302]|uniref:hypothetical protein n=1 Tax=Paenibacillus sp. FSL R7-0302 TaxID=2921681 RepID=UPI0030FB7D90